MNGTIVSVGVNQVTVNVGGTPAVQYTLQMQYGALVTLNGITCMLSDLVPGDTANITLVSEPTNVPFFSNLAVTRA